MVYPHSRRCCHGAITPLDTTTDPTFVRRDDDGDADVSVITDGISVRFRGKGTVQPQQLVIELRGVAHRRLVAFWDGCAIRP